MLTCGVLSVLERLPCSSASSVRSMKLFQQSYATAPPHVVSILTNRASAKPPPYTKNVRRHDGEKSGGFHGEKSRGFHGEKSGVFGGAAGTDQEKRVQPPPLSVSCAPPGCHAHQDRPMARAPPPARQAVQEPPPDPDPSVSNHTIFNIVLCSRCSFMDRRFSST